jgi:hypothetical protein
LPFARHFWRRNLMPRPASAACDAASGLPETSYLLFHHAPLLAPEHAARIADAIEKVATSIDELAAHDKTIEAPDAD